jgi:septation ring formation regulator EzrA
MASNDVVDQSGSAIIALLQQAAESAQADYERAAQTAHQLAMQLRAAEDRAERLQEQVKQLEQQQQHAEDWLHRIHGEIEDRFLRKPQERGRPDGRQRMA